ncbi:hypothetical protein, partial [Paraliobacillus zengyii]|uniref:hypothetical protein n=1 Tax=Paraliobacillus zengyii TaxID=2213194 RepID=UPI00130059F9
MKKGLFVFLASLLLLSSPLSVFAETDASVNEDNVTSSSTDEAEPSLVETEESTSTMESSELS